MGDNGLPVSSSMLAIKGNIISDAARINLVIQPPGALAIISAVGERFELSKVLPLLAFQASALDLYATPPYFLRVLKRI